MTVYRAPNWLPKAILGGGALLIIAISKPFVFVENGENRVLFSWFGGIQSEPLPPGFHLVMPLITSTVPFDIKTQALTWKDDDPTAYGPRLVSLSQDGQEIRSEVTLQFNISDPSQVYATLGPNYVDRLAPIVRSAIVLETAGFSAQALYSTERLALQGQIQEEVVAHVQPYGITISELLLRDVDFDPDFVSAIEAKTIAENQLAQKEFEIQEARQTARATISSAEAEAGRLRAKADALEANPEYLDVVKARVLGSTLDTLITR